MIKVITTTSDRSKCEQLERSLKHFNYDYHIIEHEWREFLDKLRFTYQYLKTLEGYTHFLYTDAWDTFALSGIERVMQGFKATDCRLLISAERNCYPYAEQESQYPKHESPWHFVNGGGWMGEIAAFIEMYEANPPSNEMNDQVWFTDRFLQHHKEGWLKLDCDCRVFQTIGFCELERDFWFDKEQMLFGNNITKKFPAFWHGNGHTPMDKIYELI